MSELRFDDRVVVVTGAGAGLGRAYAHLFASRGAKVVVNDLGGARDGDGNSSSKAADNVVQEIKSKGGVAVADYNSVVEGDKIIQTALDNFGRVDVLINNAGILRDRSLVKTTDQDWDLVHQVHLKGSFKCTKAAFPIFKKQNYGRIIMTTSNAGIYGNFGQANYSAAKMGLIGLANTISIEGKRNNIHCNVIVPTAASRLTEDILPPDVFAELKPELIAPVVAYLCHESCEDTGVVIDSAAGWAGKYAIIRSKGSLLRNSKTEPVTIESVKNSWGRITDMKNAINFGSIEEATGALLEALDAQETTQDGASNMKGGENDENSFEFDSKTTILYALGVGATLENNEELKYLYENHEDFSIIPSFYILPALQSTFMLNFDGVIPGKSVNLPQILHGEQYIEFVSEVPTEGVITSKPKIVEIIDKGANALIVVDVDSYNRNGELVLKNQTVVVCLGAGGFNGPKTSTKAIQTVAKPNRKPDHSSTQKTGVNQAAVYRLSGDLNPLHIDPNMALISGFKTPILHGLSTLGYSVRMVMGAYASYDTNLFKSCKVRFVKPVIPGQTLKVDMWRELNRIHFETSVVENNTVVISGAYVDLKSVKMQPFSNKLSSGLQSDAIFEFIIDQVKADPSKAKAVNGVFLYNITKDGKQVKQWTMDLKNAKVYEGAPKDVKPNTTLTLSDEDFLSMAQGKLSPQVAFMKGKLKITGNIMLAQKLAPILKANAKL